MTNSTRTPTEAPTKTTRLLDTPAIPVQTKLAAAWTSFMFFYIYVDYFHLYKPGILDDILNGKVYVFDIGPTFLTVGIALVGIPALMVMLSMTLPARVNRVANLVVATLYIPVTVFNAASTTWEWAPFYALTIGVEVLLLAYILRSAWTWPRVAASSAV